MAAQPDTAEKQTPRLEQCGDKEKIWIWIQPLSELEVFGMGRFYFPWEKGQFRSRGIFWLCLGLCGAGNKEQGGLANKQRFAMIF